MTQRHYTNTNKIPETQTVEKFFLLLLFNWFEAEVTYEKILACMDYISEDSA